MKKIRYFLTALVLALLAALCMEIVLWRAGYGSFPIYDTDERIGYVPRPSQAGDFAGRYPWYFNSDSMRNEPFAGVSERDLLLLGDSVVFGGGASYMPDERLGECLQRAWNKGRVWSASAGSWSLLNEQEYLSRHPHVVQGINRILWVVNEGDFAYRTQWKSELTHPRSSPRWLTLYLARKWVHSRGFGKRASAVGSGETDGFADESRIALEQLKSVGPSLAFVWYPTKAEMEGRELPESRRIKGAFLEQAARNGFPVLELGKSPTWNLSYYWDGIHPTAQGNKVLGECLAAFLNEHP